ncbi:hypothetical protein QAD02_006940 [Eretmocerus hayati]|uniref:Uncharacterized protein n=1 Tax=Eretmocerus hayati TaxID=131215 RepID=A0ACC2N2Q7_9HYME|nr:hypothetical protein QAD02_006940 [Eretmocerus hayati]
MKFVIGICFATLLVIANGFSVADKRARITDGKTAKPGQFPYQVSIQFGLPPFIPLSHSCGGSIIDELHILTAAHCASGILGKLGKHLVKAGKHSLSKDEDYTQTVEVASKIIHEGYPNTLFPKVAQHDIAILKLKTPLIFNEFIQPVQLPKPDSIQTGGSILSGWGSVSKTTLPELPEILQYAEIPIIDFKTCKSAIEKEGDDAPLFDTMICTGPLGGSISACSGDSGGPLVQYENSKPLIVGIVSWGFMPCGTSGAPSVFTRVSSYIDWIKANSA